MNVEVLLVVLVPMAGLVLLVGIVRFVAECRKYQKRWGRWPPIDVWWSILVHAIRKDR